DTGSGGRYNGRNSATRPDSVRIEYGHSIRSAGTVAGIVGNARRDSRRRGSYPSANEPVALRRYLGGPSPVNAALTVFLETPITRALPGIGIRAARRRRRAPPHCPTA